MNPNRNARAYYLSLAGYAKNTQALPQTSTSNPLTASGDLVVGGAAGAQHRLPIGTAGQVLTVASGVPAWETPTAAPTGPACSVLMTSATVTIPMEVYAKVPFDTVEFDPSSVFSATNSRITPNVAGYYIVTFSAGLSAARSGGLATLYKNGARYRDAVFVSTASPFGFTSTGSVVVHFNGTTDYVELWAYGGNNGAGGTTPFFVPTGTYFDVCFLRP